MVKLPVLQAKVAAEASQARPAQSTPEGSLESLVRRVFVAIYLLIVVLGLFDGPLARYLYSHQFVDDPVGSRYLRATRIFWTMGLPFAPMFMIVFGYYIWRKVCPIAVFTKLAARIPRAKQRRVPAWFERWGYMVIFTVMYFSLGIRMLATNGSGVFLGVFLMLVLLGAFLTGLIFTGKTWCNFLCPIGLIEKVYLEPSGMGPGAKAQNSQCKKCTACKRHCPDIDVEMGYWKEKDILSRRMATYGWPGLVFAFYWAFWALRGTWDYYFSGVWTREPAEWKNIFGPGFFFAPWVPKILAVYIALALPTLLSWAVFFTLERYLRRRYGDERGTHYTLSIAAFVAFNLFYLFAGQPTWRRIYIAGAQVGPYFMTFLSITLSAWFFLRRVHRREDEAVQERFAKRFVARWQWKDEKPPEDLREAFYVIKRKEQEKEVGLRVYADTIRELMSEGVITRTELRIIEQVRAQFNISDADHEKVLQQLEISDRQLFDPNVAVSAEERLQEQGYRLALRTLLLRGANKRDIDNLRREYGVAPDAHQRIVDEITGKGGGHRGTVEDLLARIEDLRAVYRALCGFVMGPSLEFLSLVLLKRQDRLVDHTLDVLSLMGMGDVIRTHRARLFDQDKVSRATAIDALVAAGDPELMDRLVPILEERVPSYDSRVQITDEQRERVLDALASEHDPFVRAGAMLASALPGETPSPASIERLLSGMNDEDALVREAAIQALPTGWGMAAGAQINDMTRDGGAAASRRPASLGSVGGAQMPPPAAIPAPSTAPSPLPSGKSGPQPPNMGGFTGPGGMSAKGPQPPNMAGFAGPGGGSHKGPQPPNLAGLAGPGGAGHKGPQPPNLAGLGGPGGPGGLGGPGMKGPQPPNLSGFAGGPGAGMPGMKGPQPPNLSGLSGPGGAPSLPAGPPPPNLGGAAPGHKGPPPPNLAAATGSASGPQPAGLPGAGPALPATGGPAAPGVAPANTASPATEPVAAKTESSSSNSGDEKPRIEIDDGFTGPQADTMVTGRFAVPRLPTNLGPVCTNLERILFLHCVPLFVDFEPEDLLVLARASEERGYPEGTVLFKQGDVGDEVFVIISGRVQLVYSETGGDRSATLLGPGDCIGEMSVIDGSLRSNTAIITGVNTRVLAIAGDTFRRFVEERAHVSGKIIGVLANRLRQLTDRADHTLPKLGISSADAIAAIN